MCSLQRYCSEKEISKTSKIDDNEVDQVVSEAVSMVGYVVRMYARIVVRLL